MGSPLAGRKRKEVEDLIGFFINTLVLRTRLSEDLTFEELLQQVKETALEAYEHQDVPFEKLLEELRVERDLSWTPLFQVFFNMLNPGMGGIASLQLSGLEVEPLSVSEVESKFDLTVYLSEREQRIHLSWEYNTDLFDEGTVQRLAKHFEVLLNNVLVDPDRPLSELSLLTPEERRQLLVEWNETAADYPRERCVHELFEEQAERTPRAIALVFEDQQLTYSDLNRRANQLAHFLKKLGAGPETLVGLCLERSTEMVVGVLGILKAGAAYVPLDPEFPKERLAFMLKDSDAPVLVTRSELVDALPQPNSSVLCIDSVCDTISNQSEKNPETTVTSRNLAYVIYTSGSTGTPKGVQISHRALVNFLCSMRKEPGLSDKDTLLSVTTLSFDIATMEIFLPLTVGARLVVVSKEVAADGFRLSEKLRESRATVMQATPSTWRMLMDADWSVGEDFRILCGGEELPRDLANRMLDRCSVVWNLYGPTETTIWSTASRVEPGEGPVAIGRPIDNTAVYLLDKQLQPVPIGIAGEIYIGGDGLARGYLNDPALTAAKFVPDPFSGDSYGRLYRTGDVGRYLPDGNIEFLGRVDHQVKVRGFRIELGEIESLLEQHSEIRQAVVVVRGEGSDKQLVSYLVAAPEKSPPVEELRLYLSQKLPAYMVPSFYVELESLPLTPNGKVDRRALPEPTLITEVGDEFLAPRDPIELHLAQLWESLLGVRPVGRRDNFFELGGHSLLAVRMVANIEKVYGKRLPLATLFEAPTVERVARALKDRNWQPTWKSLVSIRAGGTKPPLFLMHSHGGNVLEYHPLARHLPKDQPVYALQSRGLDGNVDLDPDMREMAATYITEIKALQPEGPYYLAGFCFGGTLAYETAQQLRAQGDEVALLLMIQAVRAQAARKDAVIGLSKMLWYRIAYRLNLEWNNIAALAGGTRVRYIIDRAVRMNDLFELWYRSDSRLEELADRNGHRTTVYTLELLRRAHSRAFVKYRPKPYDGSVVLFPAEKQPRWRPRKPNLGWGDLVRGKLTTDVLRGYQQNLLLEPNVRFAAEKLTAHLEEALRHPAERLRRNKVS